MDGGRNYALSVGDRPSDRGASLEMATSMVHVSLMAIHPQGENAQHRYLITVFSDLDLHPRGPSRQLR